MSLEAIMLTKLEDIKIMNRTMQIVIYWQTKHSESFSNACKFALKFISGQVSAPLLSF